MALAGGITLDILVQDHLLHSGVHTATLPLKHPVTLPSRFPASHPQERTQPELLIKSPSRRRRIAEGSGCTEANVTEMLGKFANMRAMANRMGSMMKLSGGAPEDQEAIMKDLLETTQAKIAAGKVRRKKERVKPEKVKAKGFGSR